MIPVRLSALVAISLAWTVLEAAAEPGAAMRPAVETRAACITHQGADIPVGGSGPAASVEASQSNCSATELDGTVCEALDEVAALPCRARELRIWDGVLDRLPAAAADARRRSSIEGAIKVFRAYRDQTCAAYRAVAVNPADPGTVQACRLSETAKFTQRFYDAVFSP